MGFIKRTLARVVVVILIGAMAVGGFVAADRLGWLSIIGVDSESSNTQIMQAIERTQEISLVSLSIQGVKKQEDSGTIFGWDVPGTTEKVVLIYKFQAKLGLDGSKVQVSRSGLHGYQLKVPTFQQIGFDSPTFEVATEDGSILSGLVPDIDRTKMVNEILSDDARQKYVDLNEEVLEDQTKVFYDGLIRSIDPEAETTYDFH